eukprot:Polyplicarium_translucidae@DN957_c0_g1_i1.p2
MPRETTAITNIDLSEECATGRYSCFFNTGSPVRICMACRRLWDSYWSLHWDTNFYRSNEYHSKFRIFTAMSAIEVHASVWHPDVRDTRRSETWIGVCSHRDFAGLGGERRRPFTRRETRPGLDGPSSVSHGTATRASTK